MALDKRWWLSLPYGMLCNQCQSTAVNTGRAAVPLTDSRGQIRGGSGDRKGETMYERVWSIFPCTDKSLDICVDSYAICSIVI